MSDLKQLAALLRAEFGKVATSGPMAALNVRDGLIALGWRPPAEMIESPEALAALATGTVIRDANGEFLRLDPYGLGEGKWYPAWLTGRAFDQDFGQVPSLNATVLWSPSIPQPATEEPRR